MVDEQTEDKLKGERQKRNLCLYAILAIFVVGGVVIVTIVVSNTNQSTASPTMAPSIAPTMASTSKESAILEAILNQFGDLPDDTSTPQHRAIQWLMDQDFSISFPLEKDSDELVFVLERYVAAVLAYSTRYWYWIRSDNWLNPTVSICDWFGLTCNDAGRLGVMDLAMQNLQGPIPRYKNKLRAVFISLPFFSDVLISMIATLQ